MNNNVIITSPSDILTQKPTEGGRRTNYLLIDFKIFVEVY